MMMNIDMTKPMKKTIHVFIKPQKSEKHLDTAKSAKCQTSLSIFYQDLLKILWKALTLRLSAKAFRSGGPTIWNSLSVISKTLTLLNVMSTRTILFGL